MKGRMRNLIEKSTVGSCQRQYVSYTPHQWLQGLTDPLFTPQKLTALQGPLEIHHSAGWGEMIPACGDFSR